MGTIFINSENNKTSKPHVLILNLTDKIDLRRGKKSIALWNLNIYRWKNMKYSLDNNEFKISAPTWNDEFELPDGSYSVSDIQNYFEYIFLINGEKTDNPSIRIYVNKVKNGITFKIKTGYYLELSTSETMKLPRSTESKITNDENGESLPHVDITEVALFYCNIASNDYQQNSLVLYTFVPNKPFGSSLEILSTNFIYLKKFNSEFSKTEVWFTAQNSQPVEIEDRINLTLVIT